MKLLLLGVDLPPEQRRALRDQGLDLHTSSTESAETPQIVASSFTNDWNQLADIRSRYPRSWFCVFLPQQPSGPATERFRILKRLGELGVNELWDPIRWMDTLPFSIGCAGHFAVHTLATEMLISTQEALARLEKNVALASAIHRELLPISFPSFPGVQLSAKFVPSSGSGGNYFDVFEFGDKKRLGIVLADSQNHKLAAALLSVLLKLDSAQVRERFSRPQDFVAYLLQELAPDLEDPLQVQLLFAVFDRTDFSLEVASHGSIGLFARHREGFSVWRSGATKDSIVTTSHSLNPNDWLAFLTDGWAPVLSQAGQNWTEFLEKSMPPPAADATVDAVAFQQELMGFVDRWREQDDLHEDLTCVQLHIEPRALFVPKPKKADD